MTSLFAFFRTIGPVLRARLAPVRAQWRRLPLRLRRLTLPLLGLYLGLIGGLLGLGLWLGSDVMMLCIFMPVLLVRLVYVWVWKRSVEQYERRAGVLGILVPVVFLPLYNSFTWLNHRNTRVAEVQSVTDLLRHPQNDYYHILRAQVLRDSSVVYVGEETRWAKYHFLVAAPLVDDSLAPPPDTMRCWLLRKEIIESAFSGSGSDSTLRKSAARYADSLRHSQYQGQQLSSDSYDSLLQPHLAPLWASRRAELIKQPSALHDIYLGPAASDYAQELHSYLRLHAATGQVRLFSETTSPVDDAQQSLLLVKGWVAGGILAVLLLSTMVELAPVPNEN